MIGKSLEVHPGPALEGRFRPPGDKSITHRAYLLALLGEGLSVVENPNPGEDCESTLRCAQSLGLSVSRTGARLDLRGKGFDLTEPERVLDCGNSGTTLRLLAGVLGAQPFLSVLVGDASLHRRPVDRVVDPLRRMGARLTARQGGRFPPLVIEGGRLSAIDYEIPVASAQVASCVMLAAIQSEGRTSVTLPGPARDHTERQLAHLGVPIEVEERPAGGRRVTIEGPAPIGGAHYRVPGDFSSAAFFLAAAAVAPGARVTAEGVSLNPTRSGFLDVLERMGVKVIRSNVREDSGEPVGDVTVEGPEALRGFEIPAGWVPRLIDEVPAWAVVAACARGRSGITGAAELRVKESDRLSMLAANLQALGIEAGERPDGLEIEGGHPRGGEARAGGDHRIAMAMAVLGTQARGPVVVREASNIETSFPGFERVLAGLGGHAVSTGEENGG